MANFGPLTAEIRSVVWGTPANFNEFRVLARVTARHCSSGRQPNFAVSNKRRQLYSAGRPSRWALAHILVTGSITRSATRRYLSYSKADFGVFRPAGATRCTDVLNLASSMPNFTPIGATIRVYDTKTEIFTEI